jgi:hypothetical protein
LIVLPVCNAFLYPSLIVSVYQTKGRRWDTGRKRKDAGERKEKSDHSRTAKKAFDSLAPILVADPTASPPSLWARPYIKQKDAGGRWEKI